MSESEAQLERSLIQRRNGLGCDSVGISSAEELHAHLKRQLELHNDVTLSAGEFTKLLNHLEKGNVFNRAKILRDRVQISRDDGSSRYLQFLDVEHCCQNRYQKSTPSKSNLGRI